MSKNYNVAPWYNTEEWHTIYMDIFSLRSTGFTKEKALKMLLIWKARCPSLPSGIESTLSLLAVHMEDIKNFNTDNEHLIRLAYSTALMRFVNHMLDSQTAKGTSLYTAAKILGVPDWVIDLRHDTAHGSNLPLIDLLREATWISLDWLKFNYWDKHKNIVHDYIHIGQISFDKSNENQVVALMNFCVSLSICAHSKLNIKSLADIPDINMKESIVNDIQELCFGPLDLSNIKKVSIRSLINLTNIHSKRLLKSKNTSFHVNKSLLDKGSLFLSLELLRYLNNGRSTKGSCLCKNYIHCFEVLLTFLHTHDLLQDFILELIRITQCNDEDSNRQWLAAMWISEILKALKKSSQFVNKMNKKNPIEMEKKKRGDLKALFYHWFPNEKGCSLLLDLFKPIPKDLTDINFVRPIISSYNIYLTYFVKDILCLIKPQLPSVITDKICKLAKLISCSASLGKSIPSQVFTVDDVKAATEDSFIIDVESSEKCNSDLQESGVETILIKSDVNFDSKQTLYGIWKIASIGGWSTCPIGQVPSEQKSSIQETEVNPYVVEPMDTEII